MARRCPCSRNCLMLEPSKGPGNELMPGRTRLADLRPFLGTIVNAAAAYDEIGEEFTSAEEFVWWLQVSAGGFVGKRPQRLVAVGMLP